ncbi:MULTISPECIES: hypothetical protein [unclassified Frankia]
MSRGSAAADHVRGTDGEDGPPAGAGSTPTDVPDVSNGPKESGSPGVPGVPGAPAGGGPDAGTDVGAAAAGPSWDIILSHANAPRDAAWARWLAWQLEQAGYRVVSHPLTAAPAGDPTPPGTRRSPATPRSTWTGISPSAGRSC